MTLVTRRKFIGTAAGSAMAAALEPRALFAAETVATPLPSPSFGDDPFLMSALKNRKSTRSFSSKPLPRQMLSNLLWAAFGVNRPEYGYRTAPSPMNSQEIEIYVAAADGLHLYDARFHQLIQLSDNDIRKFCGSQKFVAHAPLNFVYVADFSRLGNRSEEKKLFYAAADTGFISQNVYLFCAAFGLGTVVRDWIDRSVLAEKMTLHQQQRIVLSQTVGYPATPV